MNRKRRWSRAFFSGAAMALFAAAWALLAPPAFGGLSSYVMVAGASMEPALRRGDLVIVRQAEDYQVGDIVTYRHPEIGPIIHRILAFEGDRFVFKGDANGWIDSYLPTEEDLVGRFWLRVPGGGKLVRELRSPGYLALLSLVIGLAAVRGWWQEGRRRIRSYGATLADAFRALRPPDNVEGLLFILAAVTLASLLLAGKAYRQPIYQTASENLPYTHRGEFGYAASAPRGVYDSTTVETGEPLFFKLSDRLHVQFKYELEADGLEALAGTFDLVAEVQEAGGWKRTIVLYPESPLKDNPTTIAGELDLEEVVTYVRILETRTGIQRPAYTLSFVPHFRPEGILEGEAFHDEFAPRLTFRLDEVQLSLQREDPRGPEYNPLEPTQAGWIPRTRLEPAGLTILGVKISVLVARWLSGLGIILSMGALALVVSTIARSYRSGEASRIELLYGQMMVSLKDGEVSPDARVIDVVTMEDVVRVAEREGKTILHQVLDATHHYFVHAGNLTFHYQTRAGRGEVSAPSREANP
jgi:signal peptidase I